MSIKRRGQLLCVLVLLIGNNVIAADGEIAELRAALQGLRNDYEARIAALEARLEAAEQAQTQSAASASAGRGSSAAFNPAIGVIFQGQAWSQSDTADSAAVPGFPFGGEAGPLPAGLAIGEAEINMSANVDDKFTAWLTAPLVIEDGESGIEIEEAWIETTALPAGFSARFGRFFSAIGYLNNKHAHGWDFADQPLPYQAFLGDQYLDDGVQLRWIAPSDVYVEVGSEVFRGSRYPAAGAAQSGYGARSVFANIGADLGSDASWLAGISHLHASSIDRAAGDEDDPFLFSGDAATSIAHFVWKWAPNGNWKQRNMVVQGEMMWRDEDGSYTLPGAAPLAYHGKQRGWYLQAVYQPFPRWRFGTRIDGLAMDQAGAAFAGTALAAADDDPQRFSVMTDWSNSEFSRLRLQYTRDRTGPVAASQWGLQYIFSIGAHGAHSF